MRTNPKNKQSRAVCSMLNVVNCFEENSGADNDLSSGKRPKMARVAGQNGAPGNSFDLFN